MIARPILRLWRLLTLADVATDDITGLVLQAFARTGADPDASVGVLWRGGFISSDQLARWQSSRRRQRADGILRGRGLIK